MGSKSNAHEAAYLSHLFNNSAIANVGDATGLPGAATVGSLYWSLHAADPGEAGDQTTNEIAYTSYGRVAKARSSGQFLVSGTDPTQVFAVTDIVFPAGTGGSGTATHWGLGTSSAGAGMLLYCGAISPSIVCGSGVTPSLTAGQCVTED